MFKFTTGTVDGERDDQYWYVPVQVIMQGYEKDITSVNVHKNYSGDLNDVDTRGWLYSIICTLARQTDLDGDILDKAVEEGIIDGKKVAVRAVRKHIEHIIGRDMGEVLDL